jgi:hypothetical protein
MARRDLAREIRMRKSPRRSIAAIALVAFLVPLSSLAALPASGHGPARAQRGLLSSLAHSPASPWHLIWRAFLEGIYIDANGGH